MSLFKVCTWWSAQCPDTLDNYDCASLLCSRFNLNSDDEKDYIIVGSHSGHLSIFYPNNNSLSLTSNTTAEYNENDGNLNQNTEYKATDLVLETKLKSPILALEVGKFNGNSINDQTNQLAILHPLSLCIYLITKIDGVTEHGTHTILQILIEHKFNRKAYSICKGNFGKVKGRDFLCVIHIDGTLTFYEQDGINYECILPGDRLLPSILCYVPRIDSFIRMNSCWELECYSYQDLSQSTILRSEITSTWSVCIGEYALDIIPVQVTSTKTSIMVLGEHNLICITDDGNLQFIVKLDYSPRCFYSFVVGWYWEPNARLITAVMSESSSLLIYDESKLIWAAQYDNISIVSIKRSNLLNLPGGIVTLNSNGYINIGYLGSEPYIFKVPPLNLKEINYDKCHKELIQLENDIKNCIDLTDINYINDLTENDINIEFIILNSSSSSSFAKENCTFKQVILNELNNNNNLNIKDDDLLICLGKLQFITKISIEQIQIYIITSNGIKCTNSLMTFNNLNENHCENIEMWFYLNEKYHICTAKVNAVISFINKQNIPRILTRTAFLPLRMFYKLTSPQKDATIKLTLTLNCDDDNFHDNYENLNKNEQKFENLPRNIHKLSSVFDEFNITDENLQAIGLIMILTEDIVTVVAAKNTNRYRIQSNSVESMAMVLEALKNYGLKIEEQLNQNNNLKNNQNISGKIKNTRKKNKRNQIKCLIATPSYLPVKEVMKIVSDHRDVQEEIKQKSNLMDALWNQFKLFQRSLRSKKDDDPIDGLMMLIEKNYDDLITEGDQLMIIRDNEKRARSDLSCALALISHLISCFEIEDSILKILQSTLVYPIEDWTEKSWEESVAPAFDLLNHYGPLSRNKTIPLDSQPSVSSLYFEFDRFKRHMTSVLERVCRITSDLKNYKQKQQKQRNLAPFIHQKKRKNKIHKNNKNAPNSNIVSVSEKELLHTNNNEIITASSSMINSMNSLVSQSETINIVKATTTIVTATASAIVSTGKSEEEKINQQKLSSLSESEFKGHSGITYDDDNSDEEENDDDDDDDDEEEDVDDDENENGILNESDWLNNINEISTSVEVMLGQGTVSATSMNNNNDTTSAATYNYSDIINKN